MLNRGSSLPFPSIPSEGGGDGDCVEEDNDGEDPGDAAADAGTVVAGDAGVVYLVPRHQL